MQTRNILIPGIRAWRRLQRAEDGVSAIEFALFAPILVFLVLATVDLGRALTERISMGHVIRSGAQVAMRDPGAEEVQTVLETTADRNFAVASSDADNTFVMGEPISLSVERFCACPDAVDTAVACSTICPGETPTFIYYRMSAEKDFSGILARNIPLGSSAQVQVR